MEVSVEAALDDPFMLPPWPWPSPPVAVMPVRGSRPLALFRTAIGQPEALKYNNDSNLNCQKGKGLRLGYDNLPVATAAIGRKDEFTQPTTTCLLEVSPSVR